MDIEHSIIRGVPLFNKLNDAEIARLADIITVRGCLAGVPLFEKGDSPVAFYIISSGAIRIQLPQSPERKIILRRGDFFGEMGVIRGTSRSADAIVEEDSVLLEIRKDDFDRLLNIDSNLGEKIISTFIDRCNEMTVPEPAPEEEDGGYIPADRRCRVISVFSPSGGSGTTTLACSMALRTRNYTGKRVLLVDGDLQLGSVHLALSMKSGLDTAGLLSEPEVSGLAIQKYVQKLHYGIDVLPSPQRTFDEAVLPSSIWRSVVNNASDSYDYLFIDTNSELSDLNLAFFSLSDDVLMVLSPEVISVNRVVKTVDFLRRKQFPIDRIKLVLNRFRETGLVSADDLEKRFGKRIFGRIAFDADSAIDALNEGVPIVKRTPKVQMSVDISKATRQLLCLPAADDEKVSGKAFSLWNIFR